MHVLKLSFLILICLILCGQLSGQADSLYRLLQKKQPDSTRVDLLNQLAREFVNDKADTSILIAYSAKELSSSVGYKKGLALANKNIGMVLYLKGEYLEALSAWDAALSVFTLMDDKRGIANMLSNQAAIYYIQGDEVKSLELDLKSLKISEEINDSIRIVSSLNNIGTLYLNKKATYKKALEYFLKAYQLSKAIQDKYLIGTATLNLGATYYNLKDDNKSLYFLQEALIAFDGTPDLPGALNQMGKIYLRKKEFNKALATHRKAFEYSKKLDTKLDMTKSLIGMAECFLEQKRPNEAINVYQSALEIGQPIKLTTEVKEIYEGLSEAYSEKKDFKNAFDYQKLLLEIKDTIYNVNTDKKLGLLQFNFDLEKKESEIKLLTKDMQLKQKEISRQKIVRNSFIGGFVLLLIIAAVIIRAYYQKQKSNMQLEEKNKTIELQKKEVELKNFEITSSIEYALRIQTAILPPKKIVKQYLENSFILYKPKDIVAGDFFWIETIDEIVLFAACDCTGHGVPGAMVSVLCHNAINRAVREFGLTRPSEILDKTNEIVIDNFSKSEEMIMDGMDVSLCAYHPKTKILEWAGANNPLWIIRNNDLIETRADKQPIGESENYKPFTNHLCELNSGDTLYIFSDGYADQFGGESMKKLTKKRFKELILSIQSLSIQNQGEFLDNFITEYKKDNDQTDDILVMGVQI